ncbi:unnamed protein product [Gongylonema pulchrum]|uniref:SCP domain-containing protein n=1 Tax=Gongylonema pulchrum TaxID=637853 RepID=A0A3P7RF29_9BILA|nr:unnamed protein product [Gongylonema pulchrum]
MVGCGYARCRDIWGVLGRGHRHIFVCHYNPQGNTVYVTREGFFAVPAFKWAGEKRRCSECPADAPACYEGLCYAPPPSVQTQEADPELGTNVVGRKHR